MTRYVARAGPLALAAWSIGLSIALYFFQDSYINYSFTYLGLPLRPNHMKTLFLFSLLVACAASIFGQTAEWREFRSSELKFKVSFPGQGFETPTSSKNERVFGLVIQPNGTESTPVQIHMIVVTEADEYRGPLTNAELLAKYDRMEQNRSREPDPLAELISKRNVIVSGRPGLEYTFRDDSSRVSRFEVQRIFIFNDRVYLVWGMIDIPNHGKVEPDREAKLRQFVESFSFID
jgi:hypothetical protein